MPVTPFHFGPGLALHAAAPRHISFVAFCAANILTDVEPLFFMLTDQTPLHRFFHTLPGVSLVIGVTVLLLRGLQKTLASWQYCPNVAGWKDESLRQMVLGAFLGGYSHILLDSLMHWDMAPFAPVSGGNPLLGQIGVEALHWACVGAAVLGLVMLAWRSRRDGV